MFQGLPPDCLHQAIGTFHTHAHDNSKRGPGPSKGSIRGSFEGSYKGSIGFWVFGFRVLPGDPKTYCFRGRPLIQGSEPTIL